MPTATGMPTVVFVFSTKLPASLAGCNVWPEEAAAYQAWVAKRDAAEKAWLAQRSEVDLKPISRGLEDYDKNLPYNTVEVVFGNDHLVGCSRSPDGKQIGWDIAMDGEHVLHVVMVPSATAAYEAANDTDLELRGYKSDLDEMLNLISQGKKLNIAVRMFENQSGRPMERPDKMAGWEWAQEMMKMPVENFTPDGYTPLWNNVGELTGWLVLGYSQENLEWQENIMKAVEEINIPAAEIGWGVRE
jgi:hypothetical protein